LAHCRRIPPSSLMGLTPSQTRVTLAADSRRFNKMRTILIPPLRFAMKSVKWTSTLRSRGDGLLKTKQLLSAFILAGVLSAGCTQSAGQENSTEALVERAREIHQRILTIDSHDDIPFNFATPDVDPGVRANRQVDLEKMAEGGLDVAFFIVYVGQGERTAEGYRVARERAMTKFNAIHRMTDQMYPDRIELAYTADDVERISSSGKLVAAIGIENGWVIGRDLDLIDQYHTLGARYMTLAHNGHNDISDSAQPEPDLGDQPSEHGGVSAFGEQVIAEMNRVGIMVDVSHISKAAMLDVVRISRAPVIASHSSMAGVHEHARNMDDEQLLALRDNGGVVQTVAFDGYVVPEARSPATVSDFVDHIDHAVNLIGIDHVGISSDFDGGGGIEGWQDASETFNLTLELVRRGYSDSDIARLWGGNLLRVWRENERVAAELQSQVDSDPNPQPE
jgi:membrane dipeptidase